MKWLSYLFLSNDVKACWVGNAECILCKFYAWVCSREKDYSSFISPLQLIIIHKIHLKCQDCTPHYTWQKHRRLIHPIWQKHCILLHPTWQKHRSLIHPTWQKHRSLLHPTWQKHKSTVVWSTQPDKSTIVFSTLPDKSTIVCSTLPDKSTIACSPPHALVPRDVDTSRTQTCTRTHIHM